MGSINKLKEIKDVIEKMGLCYQLEILRILNDDSMAILSENSNGVFINLTSLSNYSIQKLEKYIKYVDEQQSQLMNIETEKINIKKSFFKSGKKIIPGKRNKDSVEYNTIDA